MAGNWEVGRAMINALGTDRESRHLRIMRPDRGRAGRAVGERAPYKFDEEVHRFYAIRRRADRKLGQAHRIEQGSRVYAIGMDHPPTGWVW